MDPATSATATGDATPESPPHSDDVEMKTKTPSTSSSDKSVNSQFPSSPARLVPYSSDESSEESSCAAADKPSPMLVSPPPYSAKTSAPAKASADKSYAASTAATDKPPSSASAAAAATSYAVNSPPPASSSEFCSASASAKPSASSSAKPSASELSSPAVALSSGSPAPWLELPSVAVKPSAPFSSENVYPHFYQKLRAELYTKLSTREFAAVTVAGPLSGFISNEEVRQVAVDFINERSYTLCSGSDVALSDFKAFQNMCCHLRSDITYGMPENVGRYSGVYGEVYQRVFEEMYELFHGCKYSPQPASSGDKHASFDSSSSSSEGGDKILGHLVDFCRSSSTAYRVQARRECIQSLNTFFLRDIEDLHYNKSDEPWTLLLGELVVKYRDSINQIEKRFEKISSGESGLHGAAATDPQITKGASRIDV